MTRTKIIFLFLMVVTAASAGCAVAPDTLLPKYPPLSPQKSLAIITSRLVDVKSITGTGTLILIRQDGDSLRLDSTFALQPPGKMRMIATKLGSVVFDLTMTPKGLWLYAPSRNSQQRNLKRIGAQISSGIGLWMGMLTGKISKPNSSVKAKGDQLIMTRTLDNNQTLVGRIARNTLTLRRCAILNKAGQKVFELIMNHYRRFPLSGNHTGDNKNNFVWPMRIVFKGPSGIFKIKIDDINLNSAPDTAFNPPSRASKLH